MRRDDQLVRVDDVPVTWLGANFWSRVGGPFMWRNYDREVVRSELQVLRDHGLDLTRSFFFWPDLMPTPTSLDEEKVAHYADFLDAHTELGMTTIPTFVVGHMSGENWDPSWRGGRDLYTDVWMVARTAWYVRELTARFADHPAVAGWLISNEVPIYGREQPSADEVLPWAELMVQAVRAGGGRQPVSLGDGAWGVEVTGVDNGFPVRGVSELVDFVGPHVYRMESDVVRQHLKAAFVCELARVGDRPVVLEEFGLTSDFASDENAAHYYRQVLHTTLLAGVTGWIAWNNTDYDDLVDQAPYSHHPFEMHFGITDRHGRPKPPLLELRDFRRVLDDVDLPRCRRWDVGTALVVPSYLEAGYPFTQPEEPPFVLTGLEQAHVAAREADLGVALVRERLGTADVGIDAGYDLYVLPSTKQLTGPGWRRLGELAAGGATVYASYAAGASPVQRGPWWSQTEEIFGVRHRLVYGLSDPVEDDEVTLTFVRPFGDLVEGSTLTVRAAGGTGPADGTGPAYLPVEVMDGELLATDAHGNPALVTKAHGAGTAVLGTYPLEHLACAQGQVNPEDTWRLYRALAVHAGVRRPVVVDDPRVLVDGLTHADGRRFVWLVSESSEPLTAQPVTDDGTRLAPVDLAPYGVRVVPLPAPTTKASEARP